MLSDGDLPAWLMGWLLVAVVATMAALHRHPGGAGLVPGYLLNLWLIHWVGAAAVAMPAWQFHDVSQTVLGFQQSAYAVVGFSIGAVLLAPAGSRLLPAARSDVRLDSADAKPIWLTYAAVGLLSFFLLIPLLGNLPSAVAVLSSGWNLLLVGLIAAGREAWLRRRLGLFFLSLTGTFVLPLITMVSQGFLGYGTLAAATVLAAAAVYYRPRWQIVVTGLLLGYLALSFYVTYMRDREFLRAAASTDERLARVAQMAESIEWFDSDNELHLERIEGRLNQNRLVGAAVDYLEVGHLQEFAGGKTISEALIAVVPRAIWPDKPVTAGSGGLVSTYTGLRFDASTSVGIGHVMELYVNFGTAGMVVAFALIGLVVALVDRAAGFHLRRGDWRRFALWYLPGLSFLNVGGSLVELTAGAGAAILTVVLVNRLLLPRRSPSTAAPRPFEPGAGIEGSAVRQTAQLPPQLAARSRCG